MNPATQESLSLRGEELTVLAELLESEHTKLLIEIRHAQHRAFREELRQRLTIVEGLEQRLRPH